MKNKPTIVIVLFLIIVAMLGIWIVDLKSTIDYERESNGVSLLNYEANEFCIEVAQAYYNGDEQKLKELYIDDEPIENSDSLKDLDLAFRDYKQLQYIAKSEMPQASYEVQYRVLSEFTEEIQNELSIDRVDNSIRQIIIVAKNLDTNKWGFKVVDYR